ncbi:MAG: TonB-dependent receptor, partial [Proteobacteria bacterium]|nr:TonB-dependent receptor [Pseudomonadota bacterium]
MRRSAIQLATASLSVLATAAAAQTIPPGQADGAADVEAVVVTAAPFAISADALTANVAVVTRQQLDVAPAQGLGDLLSGLPGLRSTFFGPGASRPVVRGLAGPRVQVLTNGVGQIDASALSPDHAVATDPAEAQQIEVLRGPSTLLYGGSAIGGVINIIDERVPDSPASGGADGRLSVQASTVDQGRQASGQIKLGEGPLVFTVDGVTRRSEDYDIPGPQISRQLADVLGVEREDTGTVRNSAVELDQIGAGLAYLAGDTRLGASVRRTETTYGIVAEEDVVIALEQTRIDLRGETPLPAGPFETARLTAGLADYEHAELEGQEVGTRFLSDGVEARLDLIQANREDLSGSVGVQALHRSFEAIGEEAYVPSTDIEELGVYTLQRLDRGAYGVEGGLRLDSRRLESLGRERDFTNLSVSAGVFARPSDGLFLGLSLARAQRAPREEELFAEGPHIANQTFEVGNEAVEQETAYSVEGAAHMERGRFSGDLHLYAVKYEGFIDFRPTGEVRE